MNGGLPEPLFQGWQPVRALWLEGEGVALQRRVLAHWCSGARLYRCVDRPGCLLEWPEARRLDCASLHGLALVELDGQLCSAPLPRALRPGAARVVLVRGMVLHGIAGSSLQSGDPADWIELSGYAVGAVPVEPEAASAQLLVPVVRGSRQLLGPAIPPASPGAAEFAAALARGGRAAGQARGSGSGTGGASWGAVFGLLAGLLPGRGGRSRSAAAGGTGPAAPAPDGPHPGARLWQRLLALTRITRLLGLQHGAYFARMLRAFERGDWDEALRHGIPLGDLEQPGRELPGSGLLRPRGELQWTANGPSHALGLASQHLQWLRDTYRASFRALDRAGRIEQAAYVLAELLRETDEAIEYLVQHGRAAAAAELAQLRGCPPPRVIRLWLLAGELQRAVHWARLHQAFGATVQMLQSTRPELAAQLQLAWAEQLAADGQLLEAVTIIWPLAEQRALAGEWLAAARAAGSAFGGRLLARCFALAPPPFEALPAELQQLLAGRDEDAARQRELCARELLVLPPVKGTRLAARALLRALLVDFASGLNLPDRQLLDGLQRLADDPYWNADRPAGGLAVARVGLHERGQPLLLQAGPAGATPLHDAAVLPDGSYLLALGEAGVALVDPRGRRLAWFPQPAERLVLSDCGSQAIGLARAGRHHRLSRYDLLQRRGRNWVMVEMNSCADSFTGGLWAVGVRQRLLLVDLARPGFDAAWHVADLPGQVGRIVRSEDCIAVQLVDAERDRSELWRYRWPGMQLQVRSEVPWRLPSGTHCDLDALHCQLYTVAAQHGPSGPRLYGNLLESSHPPPWQVDLPDGMQLARVCAHRERLVVRAAGSRASRVWIVDPASNRTLAQVDAAGDTLRRSAGDARHVLLFDQGLLLHIDSASCRVHQLAL